MAQTWLKLSRINFFCKFKKRSRIFHEVVYVKHGLEKIKKKITVSKLQGFVLYKPVDLANPENQQQVLNKYRLWNENLVYHMILIPLKA